MDECCGTCKYRIVECYPDFSCNNQDSEYYTDITDYKHTCQDWEERR